MDVAFCGSRKRILKQKKAQESEDREDREDDVPKLLIVTCQSITVDHCLLRLAAPMKLPFRP